MSPSLLRGMRDFIMDMDNVIAIHDLEELEVAEDLGPHRWLLKDRMDPFRTYSDQEFIRRYRLTKEVVNSLAQRLAPRMMGVQNIRGTDITAHLNLALRYLTCGSFQIAMGDCSDLSQCGMKKCPTMTKWESSQDIVPHAGREDEERISSSSTLPMELASLAPEYNKFPSLAEQDTMEEQFAALAPMPGVIGFCHLLERQQQENRLCFLLGDAGYPCLSYLLTPVPNPTNDKEVRFNTAHIKIRQSVERSFGMLKRRSGCLCIPLRTQIDTSTRIIMSCAVLHNIAISNEIPLPLDLDEPHNNVPHLDMGPPLLGPGFNGARGFAVRRRIIEDHF
ncbi:putative nuclease HARBI1 [Portunus trituberculatus]|uniref:putative nuclease HARBI1 n=1 Tax=Portunus trituberculatus TaxID=210409 RepID=UPI001E1CBA6D|nr:putative nuclease HARBI1 [Portunus trituberculatus]